MIIPRTALVLAAGLGTRMRPLTNDRPKALVTVCGRPLIDHVLDRLAVAGVERAVVNVHYFADALETHLAARIAPAITISDERVALLETGGGLKKARALVGEEPILVANIDSVWTEIGASAVDTLSEVWDPEHMDALLLLARTDRSIGFDGAGDFFLEEDGRLRFRGAAAGAPFAYLGLHIAKPQIVDAAPEGAFSLTPLWRKLAEQGRLYGVVLDGFWMHVGDPDARAAAERYLGC
ncbi:MAG: mannose-phosphate guanylyltransferase [Caulobacteraceae bacterium]|nr:mannose-phosphate guanylyltransferase [Caulobacteraceae bacterium]